MSQPELRGPDGVRHAIADFLREWVPRHAAAAETAWGLEPGAIGVPVSAPDDPRADAYMPRELRAIDRWPVISVTSGRFRQTETDRDLDSADVILTGVYPIRVFSWVKDEGFDATADLRDNLATVIRVAVLSHLHLDSPGDSLLVVPSTVVVDQSTVEAVKGDRFVAGSFVAFDVQATETLTDRLTMPGAPPRDTVAVVTTDGAVLPPGLQEIP